MDEVERNTDSQADKDPCKKERTPALPRVEDDSENNNPATPDRRRVEPDVVE